MCGINCYPHSRYDENSGSDAADKAAANMEELIYQKISNSTANYGTNNCI